jgi:hypothetical protein
MKTALLIIALLIGATQLSAQINPKPKKHGKAAQAAKSHKKGKAGSACYRKHCVKK